jgi:hypothetical protein
MNSDATISLIELVIWSLDVGAKVSYLLQQHVLEVGNSSYFCRVAVKPKLQCFNFTCWLYISYSASMLHVQKLVI